MSDESLELKAVDSMPGSINELISTTKRLRRPPSLSESFAWTPENIERAYRTALLTDQERATANQQDEQPEQPIIVNPGNLQIVPQTEQQTQTQSNCCYRNEHKLIAIFIKLLLHITLISVFETIFFFLYVSTLENAGIEKTVATFINGAANGCSNLTQIQIALVDDFLEPFINATQIIAAGNQETIIRAKYNQLIMNQAWYYVGALSGLFVLALLYVRVRAIQIAWKSVLFENVAMVLLLALYELMFFETIIYPYMPLTATEIERNAVQKLQATCGILTSLSSP